MFKQVFTAGGSGDYFRILQNMGQAEMGLGNRSQPSYIALSYHRRDEASLLRGQSVRVRVSLYGVCSGLETSPGDHPLPSCASSYWLPLTQQAVAVSPLFQILCDTASEKNKQSLFNLS